MIIRIIKGLILLISLCTYGLLQAQSSKFMSPIHWDLDLGIEERSSTINFHPALSFPTISEEYQKDLGDLKSYSFFMVLTQENESSIGQLRIGDDLVLFEHDVVKSRQSFEIEDTEAKPKFFTLIDSNGPKVQPTTLKIGSQSDSLKFKGKVAEIIVYDRRLDKKQRRKVESYLAIKYGIPLHESSAYVSSTGDSIWYSKDHTEYKHRVSLLGRDDESGLYQKQTLHSYGDFNVGIALDRLTYLNAENIGQFDDLEYITCADNGHSLLFYPSADDPSQNVMLRKWELNSGTHPLRNNSTFQVRVHKDEFPSRDNQKEVYLSLENRVSDKEAELHFLMQADSKGYLTATLPMENLGTTSHFSFIEKYRGPISNSVSDFSVFPNPIMAASEFTISVKAQDPVTFSVASREGKLIMKKTYYPENGILIIRDKILDEGLYHLTLESNGTTSSKELIVIK